MSHSLLINTSLAILFLPFLGFIIVVLLGKKFQKLYLFEIAIISITLLLSIIVCYAKLTFFNTRDIIAAFNWISIGNAPSDGALTIELGIKIDNITALMLIVVNLISFLVHIFSIEYMNGDKRYTRYFAYLGLFTFSMLGIVLTHNLLMMYIFWELVGLSSFLLIGFWFEKKSASDAAKKAFIVNRIGDIGMFAGILILFTQYKTFTFDVIYRQMSAGNIPFNSNMMLTIAGILIFMGAVGKSAQFPLHVWLPDAMEGPTPVSALIHAATMVAAGVYLVVRIFVMLTADAMLVIAIVGAITSFLAASIAMTQNDIKKVLAYSTVSQLGYMIMSLGVGAYVFAFFHLVTHAFFKAGLFLGSGSVIHSMHHEQDIRNMGGLRKKMPITYFCFLIPTLAISGIPFTSGFLSKDGLLAGTLAFGKLTGYWFIPAIAFLVAAMTAFYMFRLVILTFHGKARDPHKFEHAHESPFVMVAPLVILATLSVFIWYTPNPIAPEEGLLLKSWIKTPAQVTPVDTRFEFMKASSEEAKKEVHVEITNSVEYTETMHWAHYPALFISLSMAGIGMLLAFIFYQWKKVNTDKLAENFKGLYKFSLNKWYIDEAYDKTAVAGTLVLSGILNWFDFNIIDRIVNGSAYVTRFISKLSGLFDTYVVDGFVNFSAFFSGFLGLAFRRLQTGKIQTYIVIVVFAVIILLLIFKPF
jgi:NADH-quinone oxidoreductase subunit L